MSAEAMARPRLHTLSNGVRVVADPMPGLQTLALSVVAGRGARAEDEARNGWSHLLEHMVFKGAGPRGAAAIVESIEAEGGSLNAATGYERTSYQARALGGGLPLALELASDLVLAPHLDAGDLQKEVKVIGQEIAEAADTPDDLVFERAQGAAYPEQSLGRPILGTVESIGAADPQTLSAWRADLYAPDALVVAAAGAVDEAELLAEAERRFGQLPARVGAPPPPPAVFEGGAAVEARRLEQAHLVFLLPGVATGDADYFAVRLFVEVLGGGMASRLFQRAREDLGLAYAVDAYAESYADTGVVGIYAGCDAKDAGRLAALAGAEVRALAGAGGAHPSTSGAAGSPASGAVTAAELKRAKAQLKAHLFMGREGAANRAEQAAAHTLLFGAPLDPLDLAAAIDAVDAEAFARAGARLLAPGRAAVSVLGAKRAADAATAFPDACFG